MLISGKLSILNICQLRSNHAALRFIQVAIKALQAESDLERVCRILRNLSKQLTPESKIAEAVGVLACTRRSTNGKPCGRRAGS